MVLKTKPCLIVPKCLAAGRRHKPDALWETRGAAIKFLARHCPSQAGILFSQKFHQKIQISSAAVSMTYLSGRNILPLMNSKVLFEPTLLPQICMPSGPGCLHFVPHTKQFTLPHHYSCMFQTDHYHHSLLF